MTEIELKVSVEKLRNVLDGNDKSIPRPKVISMLHLLDFPNKEEELASVLETPGELNSNRHLAAATLGKIDTKRAREILIRNLNISDASLIADIVLALARYGDKHSFDAILTVKQRLTGFAKSQAEFAAALISYRLRIMENDLPRPKEGDFLNVVPDSKQIVIQKPNQEELNLCLRSIGDKPFGIGLSETPSYQLTHEKEVYIVLINREFASTASVKTIFERKAILGIIAQKNLETLKYFVSYLVLTSPNVQDNEISIWIVRSHGKILLGGKAKLQHGEIDFQVRSISQAGAQPIAVDGSLKNDKLEIKMAKFSSIIDVRKQPTKGKTI